MAYVSALLQSWNDGKTTVLCSTRDPQAVQEQWLFEIGCKEFLNFEVLLEPQILSPSFHPDSQAFTLMRTSGSSGQPKTILHSLKAHIANATDLVPHFQMTRESRWLLSLPVYHVGGLSIIVRSALAGSQVVIPVKDWTLEWAVEEAKITHLSVVATQLKRLMNDPENVERLKRLTAIVVGGGPTSPDLIRHAYEVGLPIVTTYGSTEMASQITATSLGANLEELLSSGRLLPRREICFFKDGEIGVKGPMLFERDSTDWFHTGDMGYEDTHGFLHIVGRKDSMFISGGENIHPEEIERAFLLHPCVEEALVIGIPDDDMGQRPAAFLKLKQGRDLKQADLISFLEDRLARFKIPKHWFAWPQNPPSHGFKLNRKGFEKLSKTAASLI